MALVGYAACAVRARVCGLNRAAALRLAEMYVSSRGNVTSLSGETRATRLCSHDSSSDLSDLSDSMSPGEIGEIGSDLMTSAATRAGSMPHSPSILSRSLTEAERRQRLILPTMLHGGGNEERSGCVS